MTRRLDVQEMRTGDPAMDRWFREMAAAFRNFPSDADLMGAPGATGPPGPAGTSVVRRTATDSNTTICWTLDETSAPFANSGAGAALTLTTGFGTPVTDVTGLFGNSVSFNANSGLTSGNTSTAPGGTNFTASCWVRLRAYSNAFGTFCNKEYRNNGTHTNPFNVWFMGESNSADGAWTVNITTAATNTAVNMTAAGHYKLPLGVWFMPAITWDGTTLKAYLNGDLAGTATPASGGALDYGTNGPYSVGGLTSTSGNAINGKVDDVRIEGAVRTASDLRTMYKLALNLGD